MIARLPLIPTLLVLAACGVMIALGVWQLGRSEEKAEMLARFAAIPVDAPALELRGANGWDEDLLYRRVTFTCPAPGPLRSTAGTNASGAKGWTHIAPCALSERDAVEVVLGWSRDPISVVWSGGDVAGMLGPNKKVFADPPLADLEPLAQPDPKDLPNNHLAYAGQWFFFAVTALVIYGFAVRTRLHKA